MRERLSRLHPFIWIAVVAVVAGLIAWPLGGWDTVELQSTKIPQVAPGELVKGHQFSVEVDSAELTGVHPDGFSEPDPGWEYLILTLAVTNETDGTAFSLELGSDFFGIVTLDDGVLGWGTTMKDADDKYVVDSDNYLIADGTLNPDLQPRLPAPMIFVFPVPQGTWTAGDHLSVGVVDRTPYQQVLNTGIGYQDPTVLATVDLTITQGAVAVPDDEESAP